MFFSWTFDLLLINSIYLVFGVYFTPHQIKTVCEYKLHEIQLETIETNHLNQSWNTNHELNFDTDVDKTRFLM